MPARSPSNTSRAEEGLDSTSRAASPDHLNRLLLKALAQSGAAAGQRCHVTGPVARCENSYFFRAEVDGLPSPVAVKLCLDPETGAPSPADAKEQLDSLCKVHSCLGDDPDFGVPRPLPLLTEHGYLIAEWIEGRPLTDLLFDLRVPSRDLARLVFRAGGWLRRFHDCHPLPAAPLRAGEFLTGLRETLEVSGPLVADDPVARQAVDMLAQLTGPLESRALPRAWLHGDFKPDNLMVSGRRLVGLDLALRFENVVLMDLAPFLTRLDLLWCHPRGLRLLPVRGKMTDAFIAGYVGDRPAFPPLAFDWVRLLSAVNVWATRAPMSGAGLKRRYVDHCFRRLTGRLCRDLSAASGRALS